MFVSRLVSGSNLRGRIGLRCPNLGSGLRRHEPTSDGNKKASTRTFRYGSCSSFAAVTDVVAHIWMLSVQRLNKMTFPITQVVICTVLHQRIDAEIVSSMRPNCAKEMRPPSGLLRMFGIPQLFLKV